MDRLSASENREEGGGIKDLISVLPSRYYDVVDCLALKNLSVRETAKRLGISEENVRKRFERAKKRLKKEWNVSA